MVRKGIILKGNYPKPSLALHSLVKLKCGCYPYKFCTLKARTNDPFASILTIKEWLINLYMLKNNKPARKSHLDIIMYLIS